MNKRLVQLVGIAVAGAAVLLLATEALYRGLGYLPTQYPGWWISEYLDRLERLNPSTDAVFVGDSRVGWGIADVAVTAALHGIDHRRKAVNLGLPAVSVEVVLQDLLDRYPAASGRVFVNYSIAGFFRFSNAALRYPENWPQRIDQRVSEWYEDKFAVARWRPIDVILQRPVTVIWDNRRVYDQGFVNARLRSPDGSPIDAAEFQLDYYRKEIAAVEQQPRKAAERLASIRRLVERLQARGWTVSMIRLPVGPRMRELEATLTADLAPEAAARVLDVRLFDFNSTAGINEFPTQDESHLAPEAAIAIAPAVARLITESAQ